MGRLGGVPEPEQYLQSAAEREGIEHARIVVFEDAIGRDAIAKAAETEPDPLVCMATHARTGLSKALVGGTTEEVIRNTDVPILLIGPSVKDAGTGTFDEMVVCLDGSRTAATIVPIATEYARAFDLTLWLVTAVDPSGASTELDAARLHCAARELEGRGVRVNCEHASRLRRDRRDHRLRRDALFTASSP